MSMNPRIIGWKEFGLVSDIYLEQGVDLPDPEFTKAITIMENSNDKVIGMLATEIICHVGNLWVHPFYRRRGIATELFKETESRLFEPPATYLSFPSTSISKHICDKLKMGKLDWEIRRRSF